MMTVISGDNIMIDKTNIIRFYERQYFKGDYWTLNEYGNWTSSRLTQIKTPYRNFHPKSVRTICSSDCRWKICPMRRRKYRKLKRRRVCKQIVGNHEIENILSWGWSNELLGHTRMLPRKRKKVDKTTIKKKIDVTTEFSTTSLPLDESLVTAPPATLLNEDLFTDSTELFDNQPVMNAFPTPGKLIYKKL